MDFTGLKEQSKRLLRSNPLAVAIFTGTLALLANVVVTFIQGQDNLSLERLKSQQSMIIGAIKEDDLNKSTSSLGFLLRSNLITDQHLRDGITNYIRSRLDSPYAQFDLDGRETVAVLPSDSSLQEVGLIAPTSTHVGVTEPVTIRARAKKDGSPVWLSAKFLVLGDSQPLVTPQNSNQRIDPDGDVSWNFFFEWSADDGPIRVEAQVFERDGASNHKVGDLERTILVKPANEGIPYFGDILWWAEQHPLISFFLAVLLSYAGWKALASLGRGVIRFFTVLAARRTTNPSKIDSLSGHPDG